jgi:peptidoglycan/xylan/chitin deacetylase (PgdA/CDA1 family)
MKKLLFPLLILCALVPLFSQVSFSDIDLNTDNQLLFSVEHTDFAQASYKTLFWYDLDEKVTQTVSSLEPSNPQILTCFPEKLDLLQSGKIVQIQNKYGTFHYSVDSKFLQRISIPQEIIEHEESFIPVKHNRLVPVSLSGDGMYYCYVEQTSPAKGSLAVKNIETGAKIQLNTQTEFSYDSVPVLWSPDSAIVVYEKNGFLYFLNFKNGFSVKQIPEEYRQIGPGTIRNVYWASNKTLMYISNDLVYSIPVNELYTRALYSDLVGTGRIVGRIPSSFSSSVDSFWTSEDGSSIVYLQDNRTLWYMELSGTDFNFVTTLFSYPFVTVPGAALSFDIFWAPGADGKQLPLVWIQMLRSGKTESYVYRLEKNTAQKNIYFSALPLPVFVSKPLLSPDKKLLSFLGEQSIHVYDIASWRQLYVFTDEKVVSCAWNDKSSLYLGGVETVRLWRLSENTSDVLFLSAAPRYTWDAQSGSVIAGTSSGYFVYNLKTKAWDSSKNVITRKQQAQNTSWRIFIDTVKSAHFKNSLYGRELTPMSYNIPLFKDTVSGLERKPRVALTFDALDNSDGLTAILSSLNRYKLRGTFFLNGEFLRRFPTAVSEIVSLGHQCGSMFYTPYSLNTALYRVDENFVRRGLARNEDDFYALTGSELSLIWHTPQYFSNSTIQTAGKNAGYAYIDRGLAPLDTVTLEAAASKGETYMSASDIINTIVNGLKPGAVIPVSCGVSDGTRSDYLYNKLDILISAILSAGYDIVPVTDL